MYVFGAADVMSGQLESLVLPSCDSGCMQVFLDTISERHSAQKIVMVMDGAGWHNSSLLQIPENIKIVCLPPYSPELNPMEHVWDEIREKGFHNRVFPDLDTLEDHLVNELATLERKLHVIKSIIGWEWIINAYMN